MGIPRHFPRAAIRIGDVSRIAVPNASLASLNNFAPVLSMRFNFAFIASSARAASDRKTRRPLCFHGVSGMATVFFCSRRAFFRL